MGKACNMKVGNKKSTQNLIGKLHVKSYLRQRHMQGDIKMNHKSVGS